MAILPSTGSLSQLTRPELMQLNTAPCFRIVITGPLRLPTQAAMEPGSSKSWRILKHLGWFFSDDSACIRLNTNIRCVWWSLSAMTPGQNPLLFVVTLLNVCFFILDDTGYTWIVQEKLDSLSKPGWCHTLTYWLSTTKLGPGWTEFYQKLTCSLLLKPVAHYANNQRNCTVKTLFYLIICDYWSQNVVIHFHCLTQENRLDKAVISI